MPDKKAIYKLLDRRWQEVVQLRDDYTCRLCGKQCHCGHHIFTKASSLNTRWDPDNGISLCIGCHCAVHTSKNCTEYHARIVEEIGPGLFETIRERHFQRARPTLTWLAERRADLEAR